VDREEYERTYPNYCKSCKGWGSHIGISPDIWFQDCECVEERRCPRCGAKDALDNMYKCTECGWDVCGDDRGLPGGTRISGTKWVRYDT